MSVDDVIARHRARLDEHRRFLESCTSTEPPVSTGLMGAPPDSDNRKSQSRSEIENAEFSPQLQKPQVRREPRGVNSSYLSASPPVATSQEKCNVRNGERMQRCQSAHNVTEEQCIQGRPDVYINQTLALQDANFPHGKRFTEKEKEKDVEMSGDLYMAGDYNGYAGASRAASTPLFLFGCIDVHEQLAAGEKRLEARRRRDDYAEDNDNDNDNDNAGIIITTTTTTNVAAVHTNGTAAGAEEEEEEEVVAVEEVEEMEKEDENKDMNRDTVHARRRATAAVGKTVSRAEKTIALLKDEIAEKDRMLLQQKSEILLLKRDLEVAKTTVRLFSLQDVAQGEWTDEVTPVHEASVSDG
ncbi:hypothetical protein LSM04_005264 [Trypanosoma melophagium]|uniref:uncharacterized protein n=1 Tax=Trypanosoma melophagium TaxID=715481 RepID=UPI00351A886C|nr:hypothetical protein LSM04_005264 [Trypanosoma melophagium]